MVKLKYRDQNEKKKKKKKTQNIVYLHLYYNKLAKAWLITKI